MKKQPKHHKNPGLCPECLSQDPAYCNMEHTDKEEANNGLECCMNKFHSYVQKEEESN